MSSWDVERKRKLNDEFDNVIREHERLREDLNRDDNRIYESLVDSIDKWEKDAIKKIKKIAKTARNDLQQILKSTNDRLQRALHDTVTEELQETLQKKMNCTEANIDNWMANLSEIRKQLEKVSSTIEFSHDQVIDLIKVKREFSKEMFQRINFDYKEFNFEKIRGHPTFYKTQHLISTTHPAIILSRNQYTTGTHFFRFRIKQTNKELFFGIISDKDHQNLKENIQPIQSIHGWWNIDRRVIGGRKEPYVSTLNIFDSDEVVFIMNCSAREIFLEYPSMTKLNSIKLINNGYECPPPWKLLIEIGKPGQCLLKLVDWGIIAHATSPSDRHVHCFCSSD
ncbi:unnamed protein product [Rotaria sp. Silwood2]|nr:unnamed protein product [Rotaria sp. Silwood2]CAF3093046.1 unnamed protein product [Rotaria sp. Silwood2]CAF4156055.1 unnamed protein product [Rotaria sp. Silwood2]CAF4424640.1 unnamed protein product [Rotaria sp. Silwood2]